MNKKIMSLIAVVSLSIQMASAKVSSSVPSTAIEGDTVVLSGKKLDSVANPISVLAKTADGSSTTLTATLNADKSKATIKVPFISADTKIILNIT